MKLARGNNSSSEIGYLVYIKPSLTGDEPQDVLEYNRRIPEFPHQNTSDQWFDESQFESYRKLEMHVGEETFSRYQSDDTVCVENMEQLMERLYRYWYPPSVAINERSTAHAAEYSRLMDVIPRGPSTDLITSCSRTWQRRCSRSIPERNSMSATGSSS
jgi:hypothetical protein